MERTKKRNVEDEWCKDTVNGNWKRKKRTKKETMKNPLSYGPNISFAKKQI